MKQFTISLFILCSLTFSYNLQAQQTFAFVERDSTLSLDVYQSATVPNGYTIVHIFGGGFFKGSKNNEWDVEYCKQLTEHGYTAVAIEYRLGLQNMPKKNSDKFAMLENAFYIAAEDCAAAVAYLVAHANELNINPNNIILEGSSAGAITALMTDYGRCNKLPFAEALPQNWKPAAVIAYSGAIYSKNGKIKWNEAPAPTLMFHGTTDKIVNYKQIEFFERGFYGSNAITKRFEKFNLPYAIYRFTNLGHEVCRFGPISIDEINLFIQQYVINNRKLHEDITIRDDSIPPTEFSKKSINDYYKNNQIVE